MNSPTRWATLATLLFFCSACSFHSTATRWNGLRDADGKPVYVKSTTNIGFNLLVLLPLLGNTSIDAMLDETSEEIAEEGGSRIRVIQSGAENYWYGWSPFTWIITPIVTDVAVEYEPSSEKIAEVEAERAEFAKRQKARREEDNSHVIPDKR